MAFAAFGTLIKAGNGGSPETFTTIAEVREIGGPSLGLDTEDVTHHSSTSGWEQVVATVLRSGEVSLDLNFLPTDSTQSYTSGLINDMIDKTLRNFQIVFSDTSSTTWAFSAYITGFEPSAPHDGRLSASVTLKPSGAPTLAG